MKKKFITNFARGAISLEFYPFMGIFVTIVVLVICHSIQKSTTTR